MKSTEHLIEQLVNDLRPIGRYALLKLLFVAVLAAFSLTATISYLFLEVRYDLVTALNWPSFWLKGGYSLALSAVGYQRLYLHARDRKPLRPLKGILISVLLAMGFAASLQFVFAASDERQNLYLGHSAIVCPFLVALFGMPLLLANLWFIRQAAAFDIARAGLISGFAAGSAGAWLYSWYCTENGLAFVLIWNSSGIVLLSVLGAVIARGFYGGVLNGWV